MKFGETLRNQKNLKSTIITPTFKPAMQMLGFLATAFFIFSIVCFYMNGAINYIMVKYDGVCEKNKEGQADHTCLIQIKPTFDIKSPKVYLRLDQFYSNYKGYVKSKSYMQMRLGPEGPWDEDQKKELGSASADDEYYIAEDQYTEEQKDKIKSRCSPVYSYKEYKEQQSVTQYEKENENLSTEQDQTKYEGIYAYPCGMFSPWLPTDKFKAIYHSANKEEIQAYVNELYGDGKDGSISQQPGGTDPDGNNEVDTRIPRYEIFQDQSIAHKIDSESRFKSDILEAQDKLFMLNWSLMETFSDFNKLWGYTDEDTILRAGETYYIHVQSSYNSEAFQSGKYIYLSETNAFGGYNDFIAKGFLVASLFVLLMILYFAYQYNTYVKGKENQFYSIKDLSTWE